MSNEEYIILFNVWLTLGEVSFVGLDNDIIQSISTSRANIAIVLRGNYYTIDEAMEARGI